MSGKVITTFFKQLLYFFHFCPIFRVPVCAPETPLSSRVSKSDEYKKRSFVLLTLFSFSAQIDTREDQLFAFFQFFNFFSGKNYFATFLKNFYLFMKKHTFNVETNIWEPQGRQEKSIFSGKSKRFFGKTSQADPGLFLENQNFFW